MTSRNLLAHRVEGDGEPLLLLNGGMMTYASWEPVAAHFRARYRVILSDLRGQLLSPGKAPRDLADNIDDITDLLDHLGVESAHVIGTSYGGEIALCLAALRPKRVLSLVAVTVADYATEAISRGASDFRQLVIDVLENGDRGRLHDRIVAEVYSDDYLQKNEAELAARRDQVEKLPDEWFTGLQSILTAMEDLDLRQLAGSIQCPTMVVIATNDRTIQPERSHALAGAIRYAETRIHETSGHALVAEVPDWLAEVTLKFLASRTLDTPGESTPDSDSKQSGTDR